MDQGIGRAAARAMACADASSDGTIETAGQIAMRVVYLASDERAFITG
jgi:hypothetical protein